MSEHPDKKTLKLGFGLMRLPKNADGSTDIPQVCDMADRFIAAGGTYFDTAYVYDGGLSEAAFKAAVAFIPRISLSLNFFFPLIRQNHFIGAVIIDAR